MTHRNCSRPFQAGNRKRFRSRRTWGSPGTLRIIEQQYNSVTGDIGVNEMGSLNRRVGVAGVHTEVHLA